MPRKIAILSGNHLCHNPRVFKEADALSRAGMQVEVLGAWTDADLKERDQELVRNAAFRFTPVVDHAADGAMRSLHRQAGRIWRLAERLAVSAGPSRFGYATAALTRAARRRDADLFIAHSEAGMYALRDRPDQRVAVDFEDWYSEDLTEAARQTRPIAQLKAMEHRLLTRGRHASCASHAMAAALARAYESHEPIAIYNAFAWSDRERIDNRRIDRPSRDRTSIHWFSQTLGSHRGLDDLVGALVQMTQPIDLHLRGKPVADYVESISRSLAGTAHRLHVHALVDNASLLSRIAEHDIGFAGEMPFCASRDLTVTNKILQYLLAGLAVVASDTAGQREVASRAPGAVLLYSPGDVEALARLLGELCADPERIAAAKSAALDAARSTFSWEREEGRLVEAVLRASEPTPRMRHAPIASPP